MMQDRPDRRKQPRCVKNVGMHCARLHGTGQQVVTLRNFSRRGLYFETTWQLEPGCLVVLRALDAGDVAAPAGSARRSVYSLSHSDPDACMDYRSHTVATVRRCVELSDQVVRPLYGVGAEVQILTD